MSELLVSDELSTSLLVLSGKVFAIIMQGEGRRAKMLKRHYTSVEFLVIFASC